MEKKDCKEDRNKKKHKVNSKPFFARLFASTLILALLQFGTFLGTLYAGGEFSYIKKYAYDSMSEKTVNRKNYVENTFVNKMPLVYEAGKDVNNITSKILKEEKADYSAISENKDISKKILEQSADTIINLLKRGLVNDAYVILDTGDLFSESGDADSFPTVYIRDINVTSSTETSNENIFLEAGSADIAKEKEIMLDSGWSPYIQAKYDNKNDFEFYYKTLETAKENPDVSMENLGYWSEFSKISDVGRESMRYTVPLIANDGTVYGVVGIGLMEKTILSYIPGNDLPNDRSCYIIGVDHNNDDVYSEILHSGPIFSRLVDSKTVISHKNQIEKNIYDFNKDSDVPCDTVGTIENMNIYKHDSPFKSNNWAIISISEKSEALNIYWTLISLFVIAFGISAAITIIAAVILNRHITTPITKIIKKLNSSREDDEIIEFDSTGIKEMDLLTAAIQYLQINVKEQASRVSKIISMSVAGIGVFMYDTDKNNVFVSESLVKTLNCNKLSENDITLPYKEFKEFILDIDKKNKTNIYEFFKEVSSSDNESVMTEEFKLKTDSGETKWYSFNLRRDSNKVLGLIQDITKSVLEMKKVEYERDNDVTTGLLNRRAFYQRAEKAFREPEKLQVAAFIMFDLDNLKYVNDTYGHEFGDDYIKAAANVFKEFQYNNGVVARMSGDEFCIFISGYIGKDEIRKVISKVRKKLDESYCVLSDGSHYKIRASGGVSWYPFDAVSYDMLIRFADFAMYKIKHSTKGNIAEFDISTYTKDSILLSGIEEMNRIIDTESIKYAFHSIVSVKTGKIYGYEALMRPQSDVFRSPLDFLRIAKTSSKLYEIERLTWKLALRKFNSFVVNGTLSSETKIFVNSISNCIISEDDMKTIESENYNILDNVVLEILEGEETNDEYLKRKQKFIKSWNAMTALDDFGSGYNSEYALLTLEPNIIKIDRSIISGCDHDESKSDIIEKLVQISAAKGILVLAEGVETRDELKKVIECGVDLLQGFYFGKPSFEPQVCSEETTRDILIMSAKARNKK